MSVNAGERKVCETWHLEVMPDPETEADVEFPLSKERRRALTWTEPMRLPKTLTGFYSKSRRPRTCPMQLTLAHWAILLPGIPAGAYDLRCRTIDLAGRAQPMPRPFPKSGKNAIHRVTVRVEG